MPDSTLTAAERTFLAELARLGVRFMVVGMSGALIQGARGATEDALIENGEGRNE
jgi:hypothetical protein